MIVGEWRGICKRFFLCILRTMHTLVSRSVKNVWLQYAASGLLLGSGVLVSYLWWLTVIGISLFIYAVCKTMTWKQATLGGWLAFSIKSGLAIGWFFSVYPFDWLISLPAWQQLAIVGVYWFFTALMLGVGGIIASLGIFWFRQQQLLRTTEIVLVAFLWVVAEVFGSIVFSVYSLGPGGFVNASFSFGYVGYVLVEHQVLAMLARIGGVYALGVTAVMLGYVGYVLIGSRQWARVGMVVVIVGVSSFLHIPFRVDVETGTLVAAVHTDLTAAELMTPIGRQKQLVIVTEAIEEAVTSGAEYLILPEDARFVHNFSSGRAALAWFKREYPTSNLVIVDSARTTVAMGSSVLRSYILDSTTNEVYSSDKQYLVPQGEYLPYVHGALIRFFNNDLYDHLSANMNYRPGTLQDQSWLPAHIPQVLFCFDSVDPFSVKRLVADGRKVPFIAHPVAHSWFTDSNTLGYQLQAMLRVHELWSRVPVVTASNEAVDGFLRKSTSQEMQVQNIKNVKVVITEI